MTRRPLLPELTFLRVVSALGLALALGGCSTSADDDPEDPPGLTQGVYSGTGASDYCSVALFKFKGQPLTDNALVLTNGHCVDLLDPVGALVDEATDASFRFYDNEGERGPWFDAERLVYATMERTDLAVFRLGVSYEDLNAEGILIRDLSEGRPETGTGISVVAGGEEWVGECEIDKIVPLLREGDYEWQDSISLGEGCETFPGTSGAPLVSQDTGDIVGVNNTGVAEEGTPCDLDAPCEVGPNDEIEYRLGSAYAQQTADLYDCIDEDFHIDLAQSGCTLPGAL